MKSLGLRLIHSIFVFMMLMPAVSFAEEVKEPVYLVARPKEIKDVLVNPGMGFTTFQRYNGDALNQGGTWPEGYSAKNIKPVHAQENFYPLTSIAYIRVYWKSIEIEAGHYDWTLIDQALETAEKHHQSLMIRLMPYGDQKEKEEDVPAWYRKLTQEMPGKVYAEKTWRIDHENSEYLNRFSKLIQEFAQRYDGNKSLESVDAAFVGPWGEGKGSEILSAKAYKTLLGAYFENFKKTILVIQPTDWLNSKERLAGPPPVAIPPLGIRVDCLGDLGGFSPTWSHMYDWYPQMIIRSGLSDAWMSRPVEMEACWVMEQWKRKKWNLDYIIEQSLKWHLSSFNAKSSAVPLAWKSKVDEWQKKMGYRLLLRKFSCLEELTQGKKLEFSSWWENKGVAPPYHEYSVAIRLRGKSASAILPTKADIRKWLPGDSLLDESLQLPSGLPVGEYELSIGILDPLTNEPAIRLAIAGRGADGWYSLGKVKIISKKIKDE